MPHSLASFRRPGVGAVEDPSESEVEPAPWLALVSDSVKSIRYGVVQIVIHDSRVVQVERTERTRFDVPQAIARE